jgi:hypothetical protein
LLEKLLIERIGFYPEFAPTGCFCTVDHVNHPVPIVIRRLSIGVLGGIQPDKLTGKAEAGCG